MPAFQALAHYHPAVSVLLGLATFAGVLGCGLALLRVLCPGLAPPFREVVATLLGVSVLGLVSFLLGVTGLFGARTSAALWSATVLSGSVELVLRARSVDWRLAHPAGGAGWLLIALIALAAVMNLLLAAAPSTKIDEIHYQMLVSARMVLDGALVFHLMPWPAAIYPQMGYGIASAPLHALGYADAPNVLSWCLSLLLAWLAARLVLLETRERWLALLAAAAVQIGLYPSVYHTTGGPHALGDLAVAAGVLALVFPRRVLRHGSPVGHVGALSLCCVVAASTKLSLVALMGLLVLLGAARQWRAAAGERLGLALSAAVPWLALYLPLCLWTLWQSGSPFGPVLADLLAPSPYGEAVQVEMARVREAVQHGLGYAVSDYVVHYSVLFPLGALGALLLPGPPGRSRRLLLGVILLVQGLLVASLLPHYLRFLSGLHHALLVVGLVHAAPLARRWLAGPRLRAALVCALTLPWLSLQAYRTWHLAPVVLGLEDLEGYYRAYIPLYDDLRRLDLILPPDAVLYGRQRLPSIYFPRPFHMHPRDLPAGRRAFVLLGSPDRKIEEHDCAYLRLPAGCRFGDPVYVNPSARHVVFRRPGQPPRTARLEVRELLPRESPP